MDKELLLIALQRALDLATDSWLNEIQNYEMSWETNEQLIKTLKSAISHIKSNG